MKRVAIVGATGLVGETILDELNQRELNVELVLLASAASVGKIYAYKGKNLVVERLTESSFTDVDVALFAAGGEISRQYAPIAIAAGCQVIDNSSAFRMHADVPLVVPELNLDQIGASSRLIANPNCSTIQSVIALAPLIPYGLKRVIYTTYQSVSGSGKPGIADLERGLAGAPPRLYPVPIANNVIPQIDVFLDDRYTAEEHKMIQETQKILGLPELPITATTVRIPLQSGHSVAIIAQTERPFDLDILAAAYAKAPGISYSHHPDYPTPLDAYGGNQVLVGRLRRDASADNSLHIWCVADNVRKGAAGNAVQILEALLARRKV